MLPPRLLAVVATVLLNLLVLASAQQYNPWISNGTCYYAGGQQAPSQFIPCGNDGNFNFPCCQTNDKCLGDNACYNPASGVTYLASCTDPLYEDPSCPNKGVYSNNVWAGLVYCNGTSNEWSACEDTGDSVASPAFCWCPSTSRTVAFTASAVLANVAWLPATAGGSISWFSAYAPTAANSIFTQSTASSSKSTLSRSSDSSSSASPSPTPSSAATTSRPTAAIISTASSPSATTSLTPSSLASSLGAGAKAGIGVSAAVGAVILFALIWLLAAWVVRRRRRAVPPIGDQIRPRSQAVEKSLYEEDPRSPAWSGNKSELPAEERNWMVSPASTQREWGESRPTSVEVQGSLPIYQRENSPRAQAADNGGVLCQPYRRSEPGQAPAEGFHRNGGPGVQLENGIYEMPG